MHCSQHRASNLPARPHQHATPVRSCKFKQRVRNATPSPSVSKWLERKRSIACCWIATVSPGMRSARCNRLCKSSRSSGSRLAIQFQTMLMAARLPPNVSCNLRASSAFSSSAIINKCRDSAVSSAARACSSSLSPAAGAKRLRLYSVAHRPHPADRLRRAILRPDALRSPEPFQQSGFPG